jgi:copper transport protein
MAVMSTAVRLVWLTVVGGLVGLFMVVAAPAGPAAAHATLVGSDPATGAILDDPPRQVVLNFSEPVRLLPDRITVINPAGEPLELGEPTTEGADVIIPVPEVFDIGTYLVSFRVVSQDSHPITGTVTYSVGAPSTVPELTEQDAVRTEVLVALSINKYVGYAGLVLVVGPAVMLAMLWPRRLSRRAATRLIWIGLGLVAFSTLAGLWLQVPHSNGGSLLDMNATDLREVLSIPYGTAHIVRLGVLVSVALLLRPLIEGRASRTDLLLLAGLGLVGMGTWPVAGHPVASPIPVVSVVVGTAHVAAASFWIGGLVVLVGLLLRRADERELGVILPEWSRWAAFAVTVLLLAGLIQGVVEVAVPSALVTTDYGKLLLAKLGLVAVVVGVAAYSRRLVRLRLGARQPKAMRAAIGIETVVLAGVLAVSSVLVQTTPARTELAAEESEAPAGLFETTVDSQLYSLQVQVDPAQQRESNSVHVWAYTLDDGAPQLVEEWQATAAMPSAGVEPIEVPLLRLTDNHASGEVMLPSAGDWLFRFTLRLSEIDQASVEVTVPIR